MRHLLLEPALWRLHRRSVSGATLIGLFCAFLPLPGLQMPLAALLAVPTRCNVPVAVGLTWITNPVTMGPVFFLTYKVGAWVLGIDAPAESFELSWQWLGERFAQVWWPLLFGSLLCGCASGLVGLLAARELWRLHLIGRLRDRRAARRARREARARAVRRDAAFRPGSPPSP